MFARIDHIGVAVEDLDAAIALYERDLGLALVHRETVDAQGVEAVLLDVGSNHVELLRPLGPDTPVGKFLARNGPGLHHVAYQTTDVEQTLAALKAGARLIDEQPRVGHPRLARRLPAPRLVGRGPHRDRPAREGALTMVQASIGFQASPPLGLRVEQSDLDALLSALGGEGWHDLKTADGSVRLNLAHVLWVRTENDEHRVGFGR